MTIRSKDSIYLVVEKALKNAGKPMTAPELMDTAEVRKVAIARFGGDIQTTINKLSDTLGFMWRRGVVVRYPSASPSSRVRYSYGLKEKTEAEVKPILPPARPSRKPIFNVVESDDAITFDFESFTLIVKRK